MTEVGKWIGVVGLIGVVLPWMLWLGWQVVGIARAIATDLGDHSGLGLSRKELRRLDRAKERGEI